MCIATLFLSSCGKYGNLFKERKEIQKTENEKTNAFKQPQQEIQDFDI